MKSENNEERDEKREIERERERERHYNFQLGTAGTNFRNPIPNSDLRVSNWICFSGGVCAARLQDGHLVTS